MTQFLWAVLGRQVVTSRRRAATGRVRPTVEVLDNRNLCSAVGTSPLAPAPLPLKTEQASLLGLALHGYHDTYFLPPMDCWIPDYGKPS